MTFSKVVARYEVDFGHYTIRRDALSWPEDKDIIPVTIGGDAQTIVGRASNWRVENDECRVDITLDSKQYPEDDKFFQAEGDFSNDEYWEGNVYIQPFETISEPKMVVVSGTVRSVNLIALSGFPIPKCKKS